MAITSGRGFSREAVPTPDSCQGVLVGICCGGENDTSTMRMTVVGLTVSCMLAAAGVDAQQAEVPPGDASRGKALVESNGCFDCHRIGEQGSRVGAKLSDLRTRHTPQPPP